MPSDDTNRKRFDDDTARDSAEQGELFELDPPPWELEFGETVPAAGIVFADAPHGPFHYRVPPSMVDALTPGMRVQVPLGRSNRKVLGWCVELVPAGKASRSMKDIAQLVDTEALCSPQMVKLVLWMAHYYQAPPGQVFDALIPAGVRGAAGTREKTFLRPAPSALDDSLVDQLPQKQRAALRHLIAAARPMTVVELSTLAHCTEEPVRQLIKKDFATTEVRRVLQVDGQAQKSQKNSDHQAVDLTEQQTTALRKIQSAVDAGGPHNLLLHGVTGSGKTEVYIRAIEYVGRLGRQAIVLVPEISLTPQTRQRFQDRFDSVAVLHSQMTPSERHYHWQRIAQGSVDVVIGPRSAVFAPLPNLGLIVIDEEHDGSFKQDTVPRYHARDVARRRAALDGFPLLLGSATPSLESWQAANSGRATLISLGDRVQNRPMPDVQLIDLRLKDHRGGGAISKPLQQAIQQTIAERGQTILLLNRRGFATSIQCPACGHVVGCPDCDMPLTHHRDGSKAVCHYCDYQIPTPPWCPECKFDGIRYGGLGTQRLEVEVKARFPDARVARMDSDTMRKAGSHERVLSAFKRGDVDILLGTQMIAKGLDFPNVLLVGVINADSALHFPDFRAAERTFQLVTQVAGRTGRGDRGGRVLVQTFTPEHPAIEAASHHDYVRFATLELQQRKKYAYPPHGRVARIIIRGSDENQTEAFAEGVKDRLEAVRTLTGAEVRILGPAPPPISRLRGKFRFHILMQCADAAVLGGVIRRAAEDWKPPAKTDIQYVIDIDAIDML
jgi:primosomal protein N' (replication factor Y)